MSNINRQKPEPGQESVWDYPRPPRVERTTKRVRVVFNGETIVDTDNAYRVLETSHPPVYYIPKDAFKNVNIEKTTRKTICEFKGTATYWTLTVGDRSEENVAWSYDAPRPGFEVIQGFLAIYPSRMDGCYVGDELVQSQEGDFYGGWITSDIVGPFKGGPGTRGW